MVQNCNSSIGRNPKQTEKLKSCKMKEGWMKNDECHDICECRVAFATEKNLGQWLIARQRINSFYVYLTFDSRINLKWIEVESSELMKHENPISWNQ